MNLRGRRHVGRRVRAACGLFLAAFVVACGASPHGGAVAAPGPCVVRVDYEDEDWMGARTPAHDWLTFDPGGRLRSVVASTSLSSSDAAPRQETTLAYDPSGRLAMWTSQWLGERGAATANEQRIDYARDARGLLVAMRTVLHQQRGGTTGGCVPRDDGPLRVETCTSGTSYEHDDRGRLVGATTRFDGCGGPAAAAQVQGRWTVRYDGDRIAEVAETSNGNGSYRFERDARGRIVTVIAAYGRAARKWDGDRLVEETWDTGGAPHARRWTWSDDRLVQLTDGREQRRFQYDGDGRLVRVERRVAPAEPDWRAERQGGESPARTYVMTLTYDRACPARPLFSPRPTELGHMGVSDYDAPPRGDALGNMLDVD